MLLLVVAFLGLMFLVSFSVSPIPTVLNEKYRGFLDVFISKEYLGETYLSIALSLGLLIFVCCPIDDETVFFDNCKRRLIDFGIEQLLGELFLLNQPR